MTRALEAALAKLAGLSPEIQDRLGLWLVEAIDADASDWSYEALDRLAEKARAAIADEKERTIIRTLQERIATLAADIERLHQDYAEVGEIAVSNRDQVIALTAECEALKDALRHRPT